MSNILSGVFKKGKNSSVIGNIGQYVKVPVDVPSKVNRQTCAKRISRYTKNGFDWNKWNPPIVAQLPNKEQYLLDGDHRRHMFKQFYPQETEMNAWLIQIESINEYHKLFVDINSEFRKNVNGDEAFVHKVLAGDKKSLILESQLINCGVSVNGSPEQGGTVGANNSRTVKISGFKRALKISDEASVKKAVEVIESSWDVARYPKWSDKIHGELLQGFSAIYRNYKCLSNGSDVQKDFESWVHTVLSTNPPDVVASDYKKKGGARQHKQGYSIALAIISEFRKSNLHNALAPVKKKQSALPPKNVKRFIGC